MNRIVKRVNEAIGEGRKLLVPYLTAGVPDARGTIEYFKAIEAGGADIIELGVPFSDALADGPVNQSAALQAIRQGTGIHEVFGMVDEIRAFSDTPLIFLIYYNTIFRFGPERFVSECRKHGIDGLVVPDLPMEERDELLLHTERSGICLIPLVAPTSKDRVALVTKGMAGFTYCVSSMGVTGERKAFDRETAEYIEHVKNNSGLPVLVGFGISDGRTAGYFYEMADGIIVGSAIVKRIMEGIRPDRLRDFIISLVYQG